MEFISRFKKAGRILLIGDPGKKRNPIPAITSEEVAEIKDFFPREKFFIFGHARSGTTLLARLVRLHPEVYCNWQAHFFTRPPFLKSLVNTAEVEEWLKRKSNRWNRGDDLSPIVLRVVADFIMEREAAKEGARIVGDKSPSSLIHAQAIRDLHSIYPDAKLVYIVRDGRDVITSERIRNFVEESKFLTAKDKKIIEDLRNDPTHFKNNGRSIFTDLFIRRTAQGWVENLTESAKEGQRLFGENFFTLRYEDLLERSLDEMKSLWDFLDVKSSKALGQAIEEEMSSNPDQEWQQSRNKDIASFLPKGQAGNWARLFTERDKDLFNDIAGEMLVKWGYEKRSNR